jgi:mannosyltransferase
MSFGEARTRIGTTPEILAQPREIQPLGDLSSMSPERRIWLLLLLIIAAGTFLRFCMLGVKSLWLDEAFSVYAARLPWAQFMRTMWWGEANMVLYYFFLRGWIHLGDSEFWLRSLSAMLGVAAIPAVYALGRRFLSSKAGLASAALLAVHSFHIHYSQDLRSYSLLTLLLIVSSYGFLAVLDTPQRKSPWVLWVVFTVLSVYAHIFAVFVLASQWLVLTPRWIKRLGVAKLLSAGAAIGILAAPMAAVVILEHKAQLDWVPQPTLADISEMSQDLVGGGAAASRGTVRGLVLLILYFAIWIVAIASFFRARRNSAGGPPASFAVPLLVSWLTFPVAAMIGISFLKPIVAPRYLLMCVPAAVLLAGWGLVAVEESVPRGRLVSSAVLVSMAVLSFWGTWDHFASFKTYGSDWRGVTRHILSQQKPDDAVIFYTFTGHREFAYYAGDEREAANRASAPPVLFPLPLDYAGIEKRTEPYRRVWFILHHMRSTPGTEAQTDVIRRALESHFRLAAEREFPGSGVHRGESGTIRVALYVAVPSNQDTVH